MGGDPGNVQRPVTRFEQRSFSVLQKSARISRCITVTENRAPFGGHTGGRAQRTSPSPHPPQPTTGGGCSIGTRVGGVPRRSRPSWGPLSPGELVETSRLRVETAMSVAGPTRRCCTNSSRSTGRPSSSEPNSPAACLTSSSRSSRRTYAAACSSTVSPTLRVAAVASRWPWRTRARSEGSARRARAGAWRMSRRISSTKCCRKSRCGSGCARCRGGCATRWATTASHSLACTRSRARHRRAAASCTTWSR
jgi:hypothetical protein